VTRGVPPRRDMGVGMSGNYDRIGAAAGAFFVLAIMVGGGMEMSGSSGATDRPGMPANLRRDPTILNEVGFALVILAFVAFLVFVGYLHRVLRRAEGPDGWHATAALGGVGTVGPRRTTNRLRPLSEQVPQREHEIHGATGPGNTAPL